MSKYIDRTLTEDQALTIEKSWGENKVEFAENSYGYVSWNRETGEILWIGEGSNGSLTQESIALIAKKKKKK